MRKFGWAALGLLAGLHAGAVAQTAPGDMEPAGPPRLTVQDFTVTAERESGEVCFQLTARPAQS
ncbi:MAG TPA: hypothetical protein VEH84_13405, partial [Alphaproteobacteria bacterium]|nr:hypothetical protein [Alphaproteobacteria bacterium]